MSRSFADHCEEGANSVRHTHTAWNMRSRRERSVMSTSRSLFRRVRLSRQTAFTFLELIIVVTVIGLLAALAMPYFVQARDNSRLSVIYRNLRQIETAKEEWALDQHKADGTIVNGIGDIKDYFRSGTVRPVVSENYEPNPVGSSPDAALPAGVKLGPFGPGAVIQAP